MARRCAWPPRASAAAAALRRRALSRSMVWFDGLGVACRVAWQWRGAVKKENARSCAAHHTLCAAHVRTLHVSSHT